MSYVVLVEPQFEEGAFHTVARRYLSSKDTDDSATDNAPVLFPTRGDAQVTVAKMKKIRHLLSLGEKGPPVYTIYDTSLLPPSCVPSDGLEEFGETQIEVSALPVIGLTSAPLFYYGRHDPYEVWAASCVFKGWEYIVKYLVDPAAMQYCDGQLDLIKLDNESYYVKEYEEKESYV